MRVLVGTEAGVELRGLEPLPHRNQAEPGIQLSDLTDLKILVEESSVVPQDFDHLI